MGMDTVYLGTVKQFAEEKGYGFIQCPQTREIFGKDIFIHSKELNGYIPTAGEAVTFHVQISKEGRPEGTHLEFGGAPGVTQGYGATADQFPNVRAQPYGGF